LSPIINLGHSDWKAAFTPAEQAVAIDAIEDSGIIIFPHLAFAFNKAEQALFNEVVTGGGAKNVSYNAEGKIAGVADEQKNNAVLAGMLKRFASSAQSLLRNLLPAYANSIENGKVSFRPTEVAGRKTSWRKDDTRLHVDAFPSNPTLGNRIVRVFSNVNPQGAPRVWKVGESFESVAARFMPKLKRPLPGSAALLNALHITKRRRSEYDHYMLQLHDAMKADLQYQAACPQTELQFMPGTTWVVCSDQVSHAALSGRFMLEQTIMLPVAAMHRPERSPLKVLERLAGRALV
jgi:3-deoxy-D-manno-oct-2-ulosonic acid (Kdo) hydroxylase